MSEPQWLPVAGFPQYEICSDGRLRSWRRKARAWRAAQSETREEPIEVSGTITPFGYTAYILRKPGSSKPNRRTAHRLVAIAFLPNPHCFRDVAHNDGNTRNNDVSNLRWATHTDNQMDMRRHGTMQDGTKCITAKVTEEQAADIRRRGQAEGRGSGRRLAAEFGLSFAQVSRIVNGHQWKHLD